MAQLQNLSRDTPAKIIGDMWSRRAFLSLLGYSRVKASLAETNAAGLWWLQEPNLSVLENTELMLRAHGRSAKEAGAEVLELIDLAELGDKTYLPYNTLSTGMRARIGFFLATINQPEVLLMDEMLSVADKRFRDSAQQIIQTMMQRAHGVVISSHSMSTITENCSRAVLLRRGSIVLQGPAGEVVETYIERFKSPTPKRAPRYPDGVFGPGKAKNED